MKLFRPPLSIQINHDLALKTTKTTQSAELLAVVDANREYLKKWLPWAYHMFTVQQYEQYISVVKRGRRTGDQFSYHISLEGKLIGRITLLRFDRQNKKAEIGYWISAGHQGKGIVTRATAALIDIAFSQLDIHRIEIRCATGNDSSAAIPKRLGFVYEGIARQSEYTGSGFRDIQVFSVVANEWAKKK